ncbi:ester cyclase [Nocardia testacea]|uniref:ester cyclase n=1 Tax=Nocardia testacea TaxID=248551 RepID=UPI000302127B|nr:nuclear transport factor 2 family protein [Nocardia testacea]
MRAVGLRMYEAFNNRDLAALEMILAPEFISHPLGTTGVRAVAQAWSKMFAASPGIQVRVEDLLVDGDRIAVRSTLSTPDSAERVPMMETFRVRHGRIAELWGLSGRGRPAD